MMGCNCNFRLVEINPITGEERYRSVEPEILNKNNACQHFKRKLFAPRPELETPTHRIIFCKNCRHWHDYSLYY
jgi:hypothetical protein